VAPARAYIEQLMPDVLDGTIEPGRVFDRTVSLEDVPDGYRAMASPEALKVLVRPWAGLPSSSRTSTPARPGHWSWARPDRTPAASASGSSPTRPATRSA
jgi:hypothetical protein